MSITRTPARRLLAGAAAATGLLLVAGVAPTAAHAAPTAPSHVTQAIQRQAAPMRTAAAKAPIGVFATGGDRVHISSEKQSNGRNIASAHGWWLKGTTKASLADVTVQIQYKPKGSNSWRTVETKKQRIKAKSGSNKSRVTAREACSSHSPRQWRSVVDVDLVGYIDSPEKLYTQTVTLKCTP